MLVSIDLQCRISRQGRTVGSMAVRLCAGLLVPICRLQAPPNAQVKGPSNSELKRQDLNV